MRGSTMRRYSHLKEKTIDFIGDEDRNVEFEVPSDFPNGVPEEAYEAYIEGYCDGEESQWDVENFEDSYEGYYESMEDFVKFFYEYISVPVRETYISIWDDPFFNCVNLHTLGQEIYNLYEDYLITLYEEYNPEDIGYDASAFIGDNDESTTSFLDSLSERERRILEYIGKNAEDEYDYEGIAKGYIEAISELEDTSFRSVVLDFPNSSSFIDYREGVRDLFDGINGDYYYYNGYVFCI